MKFRVNARTDEATISFDTSEDGRFATTIEKLLTTLEDAETRVKEGGAMGATMNIVIPSFTIEIEVFDPGEDVIDVSWHQPGRDLEHQEHSQ
jgi:hypothetical protein